MDDLRALFAQTAELAAGFYDSLDDRAVFPRATVDEVRAGFAAPLPEEPTPAPQVIEELAAAADPGLVAEPSGRYFGFVIGGAVPVSIAADWLTSTWDQNAGLYVGGPAASVVEEVAGAWLIELLGLPRHASFGFVTGAQMATFTALAAARHHVLKHTGWDVERDGLTGAPRIRVVVGEKRHGTIDRALRMLGLGAPTDVVGADSNGRMLTDELRLTDEPTIVCAQAGEVNTGAFDRFDPLADARDAAANTWLHVDGAFGLWAARLRLATSPRRRRRARRLVGDRRAQVAERPLRQRGRVHGAPGVAQRRVLGARGVPRLRRADARPDRLEPRALAARTRVHRLRRDPRARPRRASARSSSAAARTPARFAAGLTDLGAELLNDVDLNQVLFRFETDEDTARILRAVQEERLGVDGRHDVGGPPGDPDLRLELADERRGRRADARRLRRPARGAVDRALEAPPEQLLEPARDGEQRVDVDPGLDTVALQLPDEILGRDVPCRVRRERTAAEPAHRRVEHGRAAVERRPRRRVARVARVVQVRADGPAEDRDALDETPHAVRCRDADRVRQDELVRVLEPLAQVGHAARVDLTLERDSPTRRRP